MAEEDKNSSPLDEGTEIIAHTAQTAYATTAAVAAGGTAAGMAAVSYTHLTLPTT